MVVFPKSRFLNSLSSLTTFSIIISLFFTISINLTARGFLIHDPLDDESSTGTGGGGGDTFKEMILNNIPAGQDFNFEQVSSASSTVNNISNYDDSDDYNAANNNINSNNQILNSGRETTGSFSSVNSRRRYGGWNNGIERSDNRNTRFDDLGLPSKVNKCDRRIRVINGATRIRDKGALVRFQCSYGYHMLGVGVAVCVRGQWSDPPPTCVRDGCRKLPIPLQGSLRQLYGGGVAVFTCNYGYEMEGQRILTCDGQRWNGTAPVCKEIPPITIAPPSTTFPTLPELVTTEESSQSIDNYPMPYVPSSTSASAYINNNETENVDNAPTNPRIDADDEDFVLVPSPTSKLNHRDADVDSILSATIPSKSNTVPPIDDAIFQSSQPSILTGDVPSFGGNPSNMPISFTTPDSPINVAPTPTLVQIYTTTADSEKSTIKISSTMLPVTRKLTTPSSITPASTTTTVTTTRKAPTLTTVSTAASRTIKTTTRLPPVEPRRPLITYLTTTEKTVTFDPTTIRSLRFPPPADQSPLPYIPNLPPRTFEIVPAAITPEKLGKSYHINNSDANNGFGHILVVTGTILIVLGAVTIVGGIATYYWRKNKGIARARSHDIDGRTLSMSEGNNEEFVWSESRDSGL